MGIMKDGEYIPTERGS